MKAFEKAHAWRELFTMAKDQQLDAEAISEMVGRITGEPSREAGEALELTGKITCPVGERRSRPHKCSWTMRTMWTVLSIPWHEEQSLQRRFVW